MRASERANDRTVPSSSNVAVASNTQQKLIWLISKWKLLENIIIGCRLFRFLALRCSECVFLLRFHCKLFGRTVYLFFSSRGCVRIQRAFGRCAFFVFHFLWQRSHTSTLPLWYARYAVNHVFMPLPQRSIHTRTSRTRNAETVYVSLGSIWRTVKIYFIRNELKLTVSIYLLQGDSCMLCVCVQCSGFGMARVQRQPHQRGNYIPYCRCNLSLASLAMANGRMHSSTSVSSSSSPSELKTDYKL